MNLPAFINQLFEPSRSTCPRGISNDSGFTAFSVSDAIFQLTRFCVSDGIDCPIQLTEPRTFLGNFYIYVSINNME